MHPRRPLPHTDFVELDPRSCRACWRCLDACPARVVGKVSVLWHKHAKLHTGRPCTGCLKCVAVCQPKALRRRRRRP